jgi:hypothetical protein
MKRVALVIVGLAVAVVGLRVEPSVTAQQPVNEAAKAAAVAKGVAFLKSQMDATGWRYIGNEVEKNVGVTALVGLALLEAGVDRNDPALQKASGVVNANAGNLTETYSMALAIMFLDRYFEGKTNATINGLAGKIIRGQFRDGGWSYGGKINHTVADNSNTQFAILGLWTARKHQNTGMDSYLTKTATKFRKTQGPGGGWGYGMPKPNGDDPETFTMTCAGLLGLFLGFGIEKERTAVLRARDASDAKDAGGGGAAPINLGGIQNDPAVLKAFAYLGNIVGGNLRGTEHWMYLLWSIERVGVTYKMDVINGVNWYNWGANILIASQGGNGAWTAEHGPVVDTCFALLFLRKADFVGKIGETRLRSTQDGKDPVATGGTKTGGGAAVTKPADDSPEALAKKLLDATATMKSQLIDEYRKGEGKKYTIALAIAIADPRLGAHQDKARLVLGERLADLTPRSIASYLTNEHAELRRAAVLAAKTGGLKELMPDLVALLKDKDAGVSDLAYDALKSLSGKSLDKDATAWTNWLKGQGSR